MDRYYKTPILYRNMGIEMFCNFVEESIHEATFLEPIYGDEMKSYNSKEFELEISEQFFPSFILHNNEPLSLDKVKNYTLLLNSDLSEQFEDASLEIIRLAAQKCHIGQAVNVKYTNDMKVLFSISLGSRVL
jgi:hypothetical protein